jgi:hypothetical protein
MAKRRMATKDAFVPVVAVPTDAFVHVETPKIFFTRTVILVAETYCVLDNGQWVGVPGGRKICKGESVTIMPSGEMGTRWKIQ